jgi:hypothetical protein
MKTVRRSVAVSVWLAATLGASVLAWTAVDRVAADVTDHPSVEGNGAIRRQLDPDGRGRATPSAAPGSPILTLPDGTPVPGAAGSGTAAGTGDAGGQGATSGAAGGAGGGGTGGGTNPSRGPGDPGRGGNVAGTPTTTRPPPPPTTTTTTPPATGPEASVVTMGGSVTAACSGATPRLVRAIPNAGYGVQVGGAGGQLVVTLRSSSHFSVVEIECESGRAAFSTSEESTG